MSIATVCAPAADWFMANRAVIILLIAVNIISFTLYGIDKFKAQHERRRIRESTLLWSAALFGGLGAFFGMRVFHHKTQKPKFFILVPLFLLLQSALIVLFASGLYRRILPLA